MSTEAVFSPDLAGIEIGETAISEVNGLEGKLSYRGHDINELVDHSFWQVVYLVLFGKLPNSDEEQALSEFMAVHSQLSDDELTLLSNLPIELHPMLMLQGMVPLLKLEAKLIIEGLSKTETQGLILAAKLPSLIAAWRQMELGNEAISIDSALGFHENFLMMFTGETPTKEQVQVLDVTQILQIEHSFNAGTFAGRVCASTLAPIQSSVSASIGTLFGVLHGGADQAALEMAHEIGDPAKAEEYVTKSLEQKKKIMGMGHREYKVVDPRATILKPIAKALCSSPDDKCLYDTLVAVEDACQLAFEKKGKLIKANVEFYKGAVFHSLGVPPKYFTTMFAMARVYGYIAHYLEFGRNSCLIRPRARYIGK